MAGSRTLKLSILADVDDLKKKLDTGANEVEGFGGKLEKFGKVAGAAFAAAAAAAAAYAGKLAIEGVKAAIEDEAAQNRLANALRNVTGATDTQIASVEQQISKMSLAFGVADDNLRPAFQRLATATGSLEQANGALNLALDIAAAKNISVEQAANILGKAYEGNYGAVSKLGVGMSAAELKALGLEGTMKVLSDTFGGTATTQAQTLEGQIQRLKIGFEEAKESVGAALLPAITSLVNYFTNTLIPKLSAAKNEAIEPIRKAFEDNKDTLMELWKFIKDYLVPIFETVLVTAIKNAGATIAGIITVVAKVFDSIKAIVDKSIDAINLLIRAYNSIPLLPNIPLVNKPAWVTGTSTGALGNFAMSTGQGSTQVSGTTTTVPTIPTVTTPTSVNISTATMPSFPTGGGTRDFTSIPGSTFNPSNVRAGEMNGATVNNVINIGVAGDPEGTARTIVDLLNNAADRGTGGGYSIYGATGAR